MNTPACVKILLVINVALVNLSAAQKRDGIENFKISTKDGFELYGYFHKANNKKLPLVLLIHQCDIDRQSDLTGLENIASALAARNIHAAIYFQRGYSKSIDTDISVMSNDDIMERYHSHHMDDALQVFKYLLERPEVDRTAVAVGGSSCGGRASVRIVSSFPDVKAIMLLSAGMNQNYIDHLSNTKIPIMLVAGKNDKFAYTGAVKIYEQSENPLTTFISLNSTAHGSPIFESAPEILHNIVAFYAKTLKKGQ